MINCLGENARKEGEYPDGMRYLFFPIPKCLSTRPALGKFVGPARGVGKHVGCRVVTPEK